MRIWRHFVHAAFGRRAFKSPALDRLQDAVARAEQGHDGEICFAVETALPMSVLWQGTDARERADDAFARLRVWDTEANTGVLVYVLMADRAIEIVPDRGLADIPGADWQQVCERMREHFARGEWEAGAAAGIAAVGAVLTRHRPGSNGGADQRPDRPVLL